MADLSNAGLTAEEREFRDDAALAALSGMIANDGWVSALREVEPDASRAASILAVSAYTLADAMLAARTSSGSKEAG